ncbi:hypothetical protein IMZ48_08530 [Candidatus Bathyarchaeota archaeon]|nr:hypothetical protein [Candidatus Bathyarchaeota archaeon]
MGADKKAEEEEEFQPQPDIDMDEFQSQPDIDMDTILGTESEEEDEEEEEEEEEFPSQFDMDSIDAIIGAHY